MSPEDIEALNNGHQEIARELPSGLQPLPNADLRIIQRDAATRSDDRILTNLSGDCGHHYIDNAGEFTERWPKFSCALCDEDALFSNGMCARHRDAYQDPRYREPRWLRVLRWLVR